MKTLVGSFKRDADRRFYEHLRQLLEWYRWPVETGKNGWTLSAEITNDLIDQRLNYKGDDGE